MDLRDRVAIVTSDSDAGREVLRHSTAHVMAQAVVQQLEAVQVDMQQRQATPTLTHTRMGFAQSLAEQ